MAQSTPASSGPDDRRHRSRCLNRRTVRISFPASNHFWSVDHWVTSDRARAGGSTRTPGIGAGQDLAHAHRTPREGASFPPIRETSDRRRDNPRSRVRPVPVRIPDVRPCTVDSKRWQVLHEELGDPVMIPKEAGDGCPANDFSVYTVGEKDRPKVAGPPANRT
jgi:hypothetical protein